MKKKLQPAQNGGLKAYQLQDIPKFRADMDASQFLAWLRAFEHHTRSRGVHVDLMIELFFASIDSSNSKLQYATTSYYDTWCVQNKSRDNWNVLREHLVSKFRNDYIDMLTWESFKSVTKEFDIKADSLAAFNLIYLDAMNYLTASRHQSLKDDGWIYVDKLPEAFQVVLRRKIKAESDKVVFHNPTHHIDWTLANMMMFAEHVWKENKMAIRTSLEHFQRNSQNITKMLQDRLHENKKHFSPKQSQEILSRDTAKGFKDISVAKTPALNNKNVSLVQSLPEPPKMQGTLKNHFKIRLIDQQIGNIIR